MPSEKAEQAVDHFIHSTDLVVSIHFDTVAHLEKTDINKIAPIAITINCFVSSLMCAPLFGEGLRGLALDIHQSI